MPSLKERNSSKGANQHTVCILVPMKLVVHLGEPFHVLWYHK